MNSLIHMDRFGLVVFDGMLTLHGYLKPTPVYAYYHIGFVSE